jgi:hypothetical protein
MTAFGKPPRPSGDDQLIGEFLIYVDEFTENHQFRVRQSKKVQLVRTTVGWHFICMADGCTGRSPIALKIKYEHLPRELQCWAFCDEHGGLAKMEFMFLEYLHKHEGKRLEIY